MNRLKPIGRLALLQKIQTLYPNFKFDLDKALQDTEYTNEVLIEFNTLIHLKRKKAKEVYYALTTTTSHINDPKILIKRLNRVVQELPVVLEIKGNIELTQNGLPHTHSVVKCKGYLNKKQLPSRLKELFVLKKQYSSGWTSYVRKDADDVPTAQYCKKYEITPEFHLKKTPV